MRDDNEAYEDVTPTLLHCVKPMSQTLSLRELREPPRLSLRGKPANGVKQIGQCLADAAGTFSRRKGPRYKAQIDSPLSRLPLEMREEIWYLVLSPSTLPDGDTPAHFHVYGNGVYDACTYSNRRKRARDQHPVSSLLLTCRGIYDEAVRFLYEQQVFTLVLCAGLARPVTSLIGRRGLGKAEQCRRLFSKMKLVKVIIQPGDEPCLEKYHEHIHTFLRAIDYGQHAWVLTLHLNFGTRARIETKISVMLAFLEIGEYYKVADALPPAFTVVTRSETAITIPSKSQYFATLRELASSLKLPPYNHCDVDVYTLPQLAGTSAAIKNTHDIGDRCMVRGACMNGRIRIQQQPQVGWRLTPGEKVGIALAIVASPLWMPPYAVCIGSKFAYQRIVKGEW